MLQLQLHERSAKLQRAGRRQCGGDTTCKPDGEICTTPDECCGRICTPGEDGVFRCGSDCIPVAGGCTTNADCCTGNCFEGMCGEQDVDCVPLGGACTDTAECCGGQCIAGTCQVIVF